MYTYHTIAGPGWANFFFKQSRASFPAQFRQPFHGTRAFVRTWKSHCKTNVSLDHTRHCSQTYKKKIIKIKIQTRINATFNVIRACLFIVRSVLKSSTTSTTCIINTYRRDRTVHCSWTNWTIWWLRNRSFVGKTHCVLKKKEIPKILQSVYMNIKIHFSCFWRILTLPSPLLIAQTMKKK